MDEITGTQSSPEGKENDATFLLTIGRFLLTVEVFYLQLCLGAFFGYNWSLFAYNWRFSTYSGKVRLTSPLTDCKQRSSTVSTKARTVSKRASPKKLAKFGARNCTENNSIKQMDLTENMAYKPQNRAYEPPLLCHMNRFYWGWGWFSTYRRALRNRIWPISQQNLLSQFVLSRYVV